MSDTVLTNATIVTRDAAFNGSIEFGPNGISRIDNATSALPAACDCAGDLVIPGLIEMHTDNVERHMEPRPGVLWPSPISSLLAHDTQMAGAGITTVLDALAVGDYHDNGQRKIILGRVVEGLKHGRGQGLFRSEHFMHMRCEVADAAMLDMFKPFAHDPIVRLVSVMDHTPGQRQWHDLEKMRKFHSRRRTYTDAELSDFVRRRQEAQAKYALSNRQQVVELWRARGLPMASHDDTTPAHVQESLSDGISIAEFPTTLEAAALAASGGMMNVMGSPNLVRGESHSGNVSAVDLADAGVLHGLSSDYMPVSLLHGALKLNQEHRFTLPAAIATVTANIADMLAFDDRGEIAATKRADLVRVRKLDDGSAAVVTVWREGRRVI